MAMVGSSGARRPDPLRTQRFDRYMGAYPGGAETRARHGVPLRDDGLGKGDQPVAPFRYKLPGLPGETYNNHGGSN